MEVVCRLAGDADAGVVAALRRRWTEEDEGGPIDDVGFDERFAAWWDEERFRRTYWIVEVDGEPAGMGSVVTMTRMPRPGRPSGAWGYVHNLFVVPGHRDRGVGAVLLAEIVRHAERAGFHQLLLNPRPRSVAFYARAGFRPAGHLLVREIGQ